MEEAQNLRGCLWISQGDLAMTFIFPIMLSGVILAGIPIVLHLIMRQKPKHLLFPAFRFLLKRHLTNQRKLKLRHLLLLALRLFLIIGICLALARPKIFSDRLNIGGERPVAAVLLFDTSYSMGYVSGGRNRLEVAKRRADELLNELPDGSRVAVLDTAEAGGEWLPTLALARERIGELKLRPANSPVTSRLAEAYRLLADLEQEADAGDDKLPKFLYIFSDRTQDSWDPSRAKDLIALRDRLATEVHAVLVDVGVDKPVDVALVSLEMPRSIVPLDDVAEIKATVRSTGAAVNTEVEWRIDGKNADRKPVELAAGQSKVLTFEQRGLPLGPHQAEIKLASDDSLPFNNTLFATFEVRGGRRVLTLVDNPYDAGFWNEVFKVSREFRGEVRTLAEAHNLSPLTDLPKYQAICLLNVADPDLGLWEKLKIYVDNGGGLAIVPGAGQASAYNDKAAQVLVPGRLVKLVEASNGAPWKPGSFQHPVMLPFRDWSMKEENIDFLRYPPKAMRYWEVQPHPAPDSSVIVAYDDKGTRPALIERTFDPKAKVRGRVLLYTTAMDRRHLDIKQPWNDYLTSSFYMVFVHITMDYLAGSTESATFNYPSGQTINVLLPTTPRSPTYALEGPGLSATERLVPRADGQGELTLAQAVTPGNYKLVSAEGKWSTNFSVNIPAEESQLARLPAEKIEELLGKGTVLPLGQGANFKEALQSHWTQPVELFPWLMILLLLALAIENLLANKFYRRDSLEEKEKTAAPPERELVEVS
jgi:hypothetical protein